MEKNIVQRIQGQIGLVDYHNHYSGETTLMYLNMVILFTHANLLLQKFNRKLLLYVHQNIGP